MAGVTILQLPQAAGLTGGEQIEGVQNGTSVRMSLSAIAALGLGPEGPVGPAGPVPSPTWVPTDATGATDMTAELEAFVAANQGYMIKVPDNATILLKNAFKLVTTGHVMIDFGRATILYNNNTSADAAIYLDNTSNASGERNVTAIATAVVNNDATVTQLTIDTTVGANRQASMKSRQHDRGRQSLRLDRFLHRRRQSSESGRLFG